jgi:hypothetical protein
MMRGSKSEKVIRIVSALLFGGSNLNIIPWHIDVVHKTA